MAFRLNNLHREIPEGLHRRAKRTVAKEKLYKHILARIREIKPGFNIGVSTGGTEQYLKHELPYAHWAFVPTDDYYDATLTKKGGKMKNPIEPT